MTGQDIASMALGLVGTPYHDGGRVPGVGLDCSGLVIAAYRAAGGEIGDYPGHTRGDHIQRLIDALTGLADRIETMIAPGDLLIFRWQAVYVHCGIVFQDAEGKLGFVHSTNLPGAAGVVPVFDFQRTKWLDRVVAAYRFKAVA